WRWGTTPRASRAARLMGRLDRECHRRDHAALEPGRARALPREVRADLSGARSDLRQPVRAGRRPPLSGALEEASASGTLSRFPGEGVLGAAAGRREPWSASGRASCGRLELEAG